ncbi:MAG TPA: hypothetical protein VGN10_09795 [Pyrinomonadaceae bacterium]
MTTFRAKQSDRSAFAIATAIPLSGIAVNLVYSLGCAEGHGTIRKVTELLT